MTVVVMRTAVCLFVWLSVCQGSGISSEINQTLENLRQHYKISDDDLFDGKQVFPREQLNGKLESKMLYMGGVLEAYEKLIGHMLKQLPTPTPQLAIGQNKAAISSASTAGSPAAGDVGSNLLKILKNIKDLKESSYQEQVKLLHRLQNLKHIEMDNAKVQSKALRELSWMYIEAKALADNVQRRKRRRRQTRIKSHLRA